MNEQLALRLLQRLRRKLDPAFEQLRRLRLEIARGRVHKTCMPCGWASGVSSNSICMSMTCVIPMRASSAMFSSFRCRRPGLFRLVIHVISIPGFRSLRRAKSTLQPALDARSPAWRCSASVNGDPARSQLFLFILRDGQAYFGARSTFVYSSEPESALIAPAISAPPSPASQSLPARSRI